jgi:hypothetical protein
VRTKPYSNFSAVAAQSPSAAQTCIIAIARSRRLAAQRSALSAAQAGLRDFVDEVADDDLEGIFKPARMDAFAARIELLAVDPNPLAALENRDLVFDDSLGCDRRDALGIVEKRDFIPLRA